MVVSGLSAVEELGIATGKKGKAGPETSTQEAEGGRRKW